MKAAARCGGACLDQMNFQNHTSRPHSHLNAAMPLETCRYQCPRIRERGKMANTTTPSTSIQADIPPTPSATPSPIKEQLRTTHTTSASSFPVPVGDGFDPSELHSALHPPPSASSSTWTPEIEYAEVTIADLTPGPRTVTFMGRVVGLTDVGNVQRGPRSARGGLRCVVRDAGGRVTVGLPLIPPVGLGMGDQW